MQETEGTDIRKAMFEFGFRFLRNETIFLQLTVLLFEIFAGIIPLCVQSDDVMLQEFCREFAPRISGDCFRHNRPQNEGRKRIRAR